MTIQEIEALSFAELKAKRDEAVDALKHQEPALLAARYVANRLDALLRDEKLGEQGRTITALQDANEVIQVEVRGAIQQISKMKAERDALAADLEGVRTSAREVSIADKAAIEALHQTVAHENARADRLKALAIQGRSAMADAARLLNDELARLAADAADTGR